MLYVNHHVLLVPAERFAQVAPFPYIACLVKLNAFAFQDTMMMQQILLAWHVMYHVLPVPMVQFALLAQMRINLISETNNVFVNNHNKITDNNFVAI